MKPEDLLVARENVKKMMFSANPGLEIAKTIGEPYDPVKPVPDLVSRLCLTDTVGVGEDAYTFDVNEDVKEVYVLGANAEIVSVKVTPDTPNLLSFVDLVTKEYYVTVSDILKGKYDVLARKKLTIENALNGIEVAKVITAIATACPNANKFNRATFTWQDAVDMVDAIGNYGDKYLLICGANVGKDITLMNYTADMKSGKYTLEDLGIEKVTVRGQVSTDGATATDVMDADVAYLVALTDVKGNKPGVFVRRELQGLDGAVQNRVVLPSSPVMAVGSARVLAFGEIGYEQIGLVITNANVIAEFTKAT